MGRADSLLMSVMARASTARFFALDPGFATFNHRAQLRGQGGQPLAGCSAENGFWGVRQLKLAGHIGSVRQVECAQDPGQLVCGCMCSRTVRIAERLRGYGCGSGFKNRNSLHNLVQEFQPEAVHRLRKGRFRGNIGLSRSLHRILRSAPTQRARNLRRKRERIEGFEEHGFHAQVGKSPLVGALHFSG